MAPLTKTEAFAELKLLDKKLQTKTRFITEYLVRQECVRDPLESSGGSLKAVSEARQAIDDIHERRIAIRREIQKSNHETKLVVAGLTRSVADWLTWRREVSQSQSAFLNALNREIQRIRKDSERKIMAETEDREKDRYAIVVELDEKNLHSEIEKVDEILETLDGKLSLHNATSTIDI